MKRLGSLVLLGLFGCPDWDAEKANRCRALDARTGVCSSSDAGIGALGSVDDLPLADAGIVWVRAPVSGRVPVFLWQVRRTGVMIAVEATTTATLLWRSTDNTAAGNAPHTWCASAASERATLVGNSFGDNFTVSVDEVDAGNGLNNRDLPLSGCASALAAYQRADDVIAFLGVLPGAQLRLERTGCPSCQAASFDLPIADAQIGDAVTDDAQTVWIGGSTGAPAQSLFAVQVPLEATAATSTVRSIGTTGTGVRVELSTSGTRVHAAWLDGQTLWLSELSQDGGMDQKVSWALGDTARLVDLVENENSVVAILEFSFGRNVVLIHQSSGDAFFRINTTFGFRPTVAHLRSALRIAGVCDGGTGCMENPMLVFTRKPDGSTW